MGNDSIPSNATSHHHATPDLTEQTFCLFCFFLYVLSLLNLPPTSPPTPQGGHRALVWAPWVIQQIPTGCLLYIWQCMLPCYSLHSSPSLLPPLCSLYLRGSVLFMLCMRTLKREKKMCLMPNESFDKYVTWVGQWEAGASYSFIPSDFHAQGDCSSHRGAGGGPQGRWMKTFSFNSHVSIIMCIRKKTQLVYQSCEFKDMILTKRLHFFLKWIILKTNNKQWNGWKREGVKTMSEYAESPRFGNTTGSKQILFKYFPLLSLERQ